MATNIKKEIPTWLINGINKVYTLLNVPSQIDDVFMDWVIYTDFTIVWNVLTLVDAPSLSLFVDYTTADSSIIISTDITFWDIKDKVWNLLWQKSTSTTFNTNIVWDVINNISRQVLRWRVKSLLNPNQIFRAWKLWFIDWKINLRFKQWAALSAPLEVWDITASMDTTYMLGNGYCEIGWDTIKYTGSTPTSLTWVIWQTVEHLWSELVVQLYEVPIDFEKPEEMWLINRNNTVYKQEIHFDDTNTKLVYYDIVRYWTKQLVKIVWLRNNDLVELHYTKKYSDMGADTDVNPLPDDYGITVLAYLVAWQFAYEKSLPNSQPILNIAYENLQNFYQFNTNTKNIIKQTIKPISYRNK